MDEDTISDAGVGVGATTDGIAPQTPGFKVSAQTPGFQVSAQTRVPGPGTDPWAPGLGTDPWAPPGPGTDPRAPGLGTDPWAPGLGTDPWAPVGALTLALAMVDTWPGWTHDWLLDRALHKDTQSTNFCGISGGEYYHTTHRASTTWTLASVSSGTGLSTTAPLTATSGM
jgi:hypothetical protein